MAIKFISKWYGGITRDERSKQVGVGSNFEELEIFENADYVRPTQIVSSDSMPASTEIYAKTVGNDGTVYGYGKETGAGKVRLVSVASGGDDNPGAFATLFTSADATNLAYINSPIQFHKTTESNKYYLYYLTLAGSTVILKRYDIVGAAESTVGTLTGLDGTFDRTSFRILYGELHITNGNYMAKVDDAGVFTNIAFTLPNDWEAVDVCEAGNGAVILCRNINRFANYCKGFFWDLASSSQFDDSFDVPFGGPQWVQKHRETVKIMCAINGEARFWQLSGVFAGAIPQPLPWMALTSVASETSTQPISSQKMVATQTDILYFSVYKTDKTAIYAIGQLDATKQQALVLAKRLDTSSYALHIPYSLLIVGPNFYADFSDNGTAESCRCEGNNSPARSSNAVYETVTLDDDNAVSLKMVPDVIIGAQSIPASCNIAVSVLTDGGAYVAKTQADGTNMTSGQTNATFKALIAGVKTFKIKVAFTSSGTSTPKLTSLAWNVTTQKHTAFV